MDLSGFIARIARRKGSLDLANKSPWVFPSKSGQRLTYAVAQAALKEMVECGQVHKFPVMEHMSWHWFRRIFATRFIESNPAKLPVLIELLGHMTPNTVHRPPLCQTLRSVDR